MTQSDVDQLRIAVIGLGYWGPNLVRNLADTPGARAAMACDSDPERCAAIARRYPSLHVTSDLQEVMRSPDIDAVCIATPVATHYDLARQAFLRDKHVLVEKPLTNSVRDAERLVETAEGRGLTLMVGHTYIYTGAVRLLRELARSGAVGDLYYLESERLNLGLFRPDVNVVWDLAPHDLSIFHYLTVGRPMWITAIGTDPTGSGTESVAHLTIEYENGILGHVYVSWLSPVKTRRLVLAGSRKMVEYDDVEPSEKIRIYDRGVEFKGDSEDSLHPTYRLGDIHIPATDNTEALRTQLEEFVGAIKDARKAETDGQFGVEIVRLLEACQESMRSYTRVRLAG